MNSDDNYLKKPKTWFIIFGIICVIILCYIIYKMLKTTPPPPSIFCNDPQVRIVCPDNSLQCADKCDDGKNWDCVNKKCVCNDPNQVIQTCADNTSQCGDKCDDEKMWDCVSKKCVCKSGTTLCVGGTKCCEVCTKDVCCSEDNQIKAPDGTYQCCNPGTQPNADKTACISICGNGTCTDGQECIQITNLSQSAYDDLENTYCKDPNFKGGSCDAINKVCNVSLCSNGASCQWNDNEIGLPWITSGAKTYYDFSGIGLDGDSLCYPNSSNDNSCYNNTIEYDCSKNANCVWVPSIIQSYSSDALGTKTILQNWQKFMSKSPEGYYCGDSTQPFARLEQISSTSGCGWQDCINRMSNKGTTQVIWDSVNNTCTSLIGGTSDGGIGGKILCTGVGEPCSNCTGVGTYGDCIKCTGDGEPCSNCTTGTYISKSECLSNNWEFKPCARVINGINTSVLKYSCSDSSSDCSCGNQDKGIFCGNCPWGGNDSGNPLYYKVDPLVNNASYGETQDGGTNGFVCHSDNQIKLPPVEGWVYNGKNFPDIDCNFQVVTDGEIGYPDRQSCMDATCSTSKQCCDTGWNFKNGKCYPNNTSSCNSVYDSIGRPYGLGRLYTCYDKSHSGACGPSYQGGCIKKDKTSSDVATCGNIPDVEPVNKDKIQYCICDGNSWGNLGSVSSYYKTIYGDCNGGQGPVNMGCDENSADNCKSN